MATITLSKWKAAGLLLSVAAALWILGNRAEARQTIVLKTGESIEADGVRVEQTRIWFVFNGLTVSVDKKDVQRIEDGGKTRTILSGQVPVRTAKPRTGDTGRPATPEPAAGQKRPGAQTVPIEKKQNAETEPKAGSIPPPASRRRPAARKNRSGRNVRLSAALKPGGFGDMNWGDRITSRAGLRRLDRKGELPEVVEYVRTDETLQLGTKQQPVVRYAFWKDRLYMVTVWAEGPESYRSMRRAMFERFGPGIPRPDHRQTCYWVDDDADRMIDYLDGEKMGMLWMRSREINHQYQLTRLRIPVNAARSGPAAYR